MEHELDLDIELDLSEPKKYKVLLLNDNYTTFEFVIDILKVVFKKSEQEAINLTYQIHEKGRAVCGIYPYEIALTKVKQVEFNAKKAGFPLKAVMEEE